MANAILTNSGSSVEPAAINSIIEKYKASFDIISANTFVDFVNNTTVDSGITKQIHSVSGAGLITSKYVENLNNTHCDMGLSGEYRYRSAGHRFGLGETIFKLDDVTVLYFHTRQDASTTYTNYVAMLTFDNNEIIVNKVENLTGTGSNLKVIQMADTRFCVASGSYYNSTSGSYLLTLQTIHVDIEDKTFTKVATAGVTNVYRLVSLLDGFKVSDTEVIFLHSSGPTNASYYYHGFTTAVIGVDGTITIKTNSYGTGASTTSDGAHFATVRKISDRKYVEIYHYNLPLLKIITVNADTTATAGSIITLPGSNYTTREYIAQPFTKGNYLYVPYFDGKTWTLTSVECSGTNPVIKASQPFAINGATYPIIKKVSDNQAVALQLNSTLGYSTLFTLNDDGTIDVSPANLTSASGISVSALLKFVQTGVDQGFALYKTNGQVHGLVAIPMTFINGAIDVGEPQIWNDSYDWTLSDGYYHYTEYVGEGSTLFVYQPYVYNVRNSINCFAVYQKGLTLTRGQTHNIFKSDAHLNTTGRFISDLVVDKNDRSVSILFREFNNINTSSYDLYYINVFVRGDESYLSEVHKLRNYNETTNATYEYARLIPVAPNKMFAVYNMTADISHGTAFTINKRFEVVSAEKTGSIGGWTQTQCTPEVAGNVVLVGA